MARGLLLTVREAADRLRVKPVTVYRLCARGELPHVRVSNAIRILVSDVDVIMARSTRSTEGAVTRRAPRARD
ncbi:MAG: helix-turn-helix domain-containing protein [Deltaproteobacteria bacterium]|nr:helix-turn-helix domain-containing protein [Deltaproteobacteria bacterium]